MTAGREITPRDAANVDSDGVVVPAHLAGTVREILIRCLRDDARSDPEVVATLEALAIAAAEYEAWERQNQKAVVS